MNDSAVFLKKGTRMLILFWCAGLLAGLLLANCAELTFYSWLSSLLCAPVSALCLTGSLVLPFLLSELCFRCRRIFWLPVIGFSRAFRFSVCAAGIFHAAGSAGWLLFLLVLTPDFLALPLLWWYWITSLSAPGRAHSYFFSKCVFAVILGGAAYMIWISPFLAEIIT